MSAPTKAAIKQNSAKEECAPAHKRPNLRKPIGGASGTSISKPVPVQPMGEATNQGVKNYPSPRAKKSQCRFLQRKIGQADRPIFVDGLWR